jgi:cytochrome P450
MLSAEGETYRRQRRVISPAFSPQNLRELVPLVFRKGLELRVRWEGLVFDTPRKDQTVVDVSHWFSRATFDVIGAFGRSYGSSVFSLI